MGKDNKWDVSPFPVPSGGAAGDPGNAGTALSSRQMGGIGIVNMLELYGGGVIIIIIIAPTVNLTGAVLKADGATGSNGSGGRGGGGGLIYVATKSYTAPATAPPVAGGAGGSGGLQNGGAGSAGVVQVDIFA